MSHAQSQLRTAKKAYSLAARQIDLTAKSSGLTDRISQQLIGTGVAADWTLRAAHLERLEYSTEGLNKPARQRTITELVRFTFSWYAVNAIFARDELLSAIAVAGGETATSWASELERFRVLHRLAAIPAEPTYRARIEHVLRTSRRQRTPITATQSPASILGAVHLRYVPSSERRKRLARVLETAAATGNYSAIDMPILIYMIRYWSVHGNTLDGAFEGKLNYLQVVESCQDALADIHVSTSTLLLRLASTGGL